MKRLSIVILFLGLLSCEKQKDPYWSEVDFDAKISSDPAFLKMDEEGFVSLSDNPKISKTSDVRYNKKDLNRTDNLNMDNTFKNFVCSAIFNHSDTLFIDIGLHSWFSGSGFVLSFFNRTFNAQPYSYTDIVLENQTRPTYKILSQKLTLNKLSFVVGDSIYGSVEFRIIETNGKLQTRHAANVSSVQKSSNNNFPFSPIKIQLNTPYN